MEIERVAAKSVVRRDKKTGNINLNPYQGCWHDCVYCDGKAENYHMHEDFGTRIKVKENAPELLEKFLKKQEFIPVNRERTGTLLDFGKDRPQIDQPEKFTICIGGGVCDVYQPAETEVGMTRTLLQLVNDYDIPVFILTKNKLVLRDLDLLKRINESTKATVAMSVTLADDDVQKVFEPRASSTSERFETLRTLHEEGVHTGIWFMPILPWIGDTDENLDAVFGRAKESSIEWMCWSGLTLKSGRQKEQFMSVIGQHYPDMLPKYRKLYGNDNKWGMLDTGAARELGLVNAYEKGKVFARKHGIVTKGWFGDGKW